MAGRTNITDTNNLTCPVCDYTVDQSQSSRRTICPNCGHFYNANAASNPHLLGQRARRQVRERGNKTDRPSSLENDNEKDKPGGRLQTLANFFQNLAQHRRSQNAGSTSNESGQSSTMTQDSKGRQKNNDSSLPPIAQQSRGQLTASGTPASLSPCPPSSSSGSGGHRSTRPGSRININSSSLVDSHGNHTVSALRNKSLEQLRDAVSAAAASNNWQKISHLYSSCFDSFSEINANFKRDVNKEYKTTEDSGLNLDFVYGVYNILEKLPQDAQKAVLKSVINSLLKDKRLSDTTRPWPHTKDDIRAYLVLLLNPQFSNMTTYVIFAHLLRQMATLSDHDHHYLVHWFKRIEPTVFRLLVEKMHNFISCRLFPPKPQDLPPLAKCTWWIPSATKVLALLNAANNLTRPAVVSYMDFYNSTLDHLDLMAEYYTWQNPSAHPGFSFCQYPFILSITAKRCILQRDSEQQMIIMVRRSLVAKVQQRQMPDIGMLFLNLTVRRSHLVSDSLNEVARKQHDLKKKLKVTFAGEPGLDMGGLTKEWFLLLIRQIFQPEYGMFVFNKKSRSFWFSSAPCESYQEFNLVGVLMGLAVYNSIILDIRFPPVCYRKLLSPAVVPYNNPRSTVGVTPVTCKDLQDAMPDLAHGLQELLDYEGDVEEDFGLSFQISLTELGVTKTYNLKSGGDKIPVTSQNRKEYVQMYIEFTLNKAVYKQFQAFYHGFHSVCASNALIMLRPEEVELLVCGNPNLKMSDLKKVTVYDGYDEQDASIKYFWDVVLALPKELQKRLLLFATGSDRIPIGGMGEMTFKISKVDNPTMLPMSHTCFNQLVLPVYKTKKILKQKLLIAIQNAEGFGLE